MSAPQAAGEVVQPGAPAKGHRWPRGTGIDRGREPGHGRDDWAAHVVERYTAAVGDMTKLLEKLEPCRVLDTRTVILDSLGQADVQVRVPFQAIHVTSMSENVLTLTPAPRQGSAPTSGPGVCIIGIRGQQTFNISGYVWSIYGGNPGDLVTVQTFSKTIPPVGGPGAAGQTTAQLSQTQAAPAAGSNFVYTAPAGAPTRIVSATGVLTTSAAVANRFFQVVIKDASGNILAQVGDATATPASTVLRMTAAPGIAQVNSASGVAAVALPISVLQPGWTLGFSISSIDAADQLNQIVLVTQT